MLELAFRGLGGDAPVGAQTRRARRIRGDAAAVEETTPRTPARRSTPAWENDVRSIPSAGRQLGTVIALLATPRLLLRHAPLFGTCAQIPTRAAGITLATPRFLDKCHDLGMRVDFWTINDPREAERLLDLGADGIMTDDPRAIAPVFAARRRGL